MKVHYLKTWVEYFQEIKYGNKTFELRKNDRDYQQGDVLCLQEYDSELGIYTGDYTCQFVTYILRDCQWLPANVVIMSIRGIDKKDIG